MGKPRVHALHDTGFRVAGDPVNSQYHALCGVPFTLHLNPDTTTWLHHLVTCKSCQKAIVTRQPIGQSTLDTWKAQP